MAKKRYHQSKKDRLHEKEGMEKAMHKKYGEYKQSAKDRRDEARGMEKAEHRRRLMHDERDYHMDPRRRHELEDAGMIHEDHREIANLPQSVKMQPYPKTDYYNYHLNDDIRGIDVQMDDDVRKERRKAGEMYPEKY